MNISKTKRNFIGLNTLFAILSAGVGAVILHVALPGHYFGGYPFIPTYFYLFGLFSIYMFDACRQHAPQKMLLLYLAIKMVKMILSIILVLIYCLAVREEAKAFLLTFISFYLLYLIYETWFFFSFEVNLKRKKKNKKKQNKAKKTEKENKNTGNSKVFQNKENQGDTVEYTHVKDEAVKFHCTQNTDSFHTPRIQIISRGSVQILSFRLNKTECPWHWEGDWIIPDTEDENVKEIELLVISQGGKLIKMNPRIFSS